MSIEVNALTKIYGAQKAVDEINFKVAKGEIVGFLGPNGAGKSTTMKMITGYLQPNKGNAIVCGIDVESRPIEAKSKVGYLPESNPLYYDMYVKEYLDFVADVHQIAYKKKKIEEVIGVTGLSNESGKKTGQLSKGYKQRVGLAAALIHDPEVLILDEPTSGLDPNQIVEIREVIKSLGQNKTVLFSSHILQEVEAICDRVIIINKGRLVADDKLSALRRNNNNNHIVLVEFKESLHRNLFDKMESIDRVEEIRPSSYKISTADPELVRRQLMQIAINQNLNIVSLQSESHSLEEIFRELTSREPPKSGSS